MLKKSILAVLTLFMLTACGNKEEDLSAEERQSVIDDGTAGFEMNGGEVEKAKNVPAKDQQAILAAFDEYIAALNAEEIERYMQTVSKNPKGFKYEEEEAYAAEVFEKFDIKRDVENIVITKYSEKEAQVYANMTLHTRQLETNVEHESAGRQVTVFVKEDNAWKVTSVFYLGDDSKSSTSN
ncbi:hypothetical protein AEA09_18140 [Lysinibacillus contaminans]|uniref:DUF3225 domain-containing protein n=1 Tax=Lysinibacillus contaminans TaxID=1293441 RepID=A0ABR5JYC9_9BACI|nr:DUF3225 domain-containing protein [Lysinibacillus contaminans]KOS66654.1 hypothetical protein AEA09_18140 [Lysinibacillus contaminans]